MADLHDSTTATPAQRRPSILLLIAGLACLLVSVSALSGVNPVGLFGDIRLGWLFVVAAVVIGVLLVMTPARVLRRKSR